MPHSRNHTIDLMRLMACPFIVLIHCPLSGELGQVLIRLGRFGVPFFLLVSGWFSYAPSRASMEEHARKKLGDTLGLLGIFCGAYLIMNSLTSYLSGAGCFSWLSDYANAKTLASLILFNRARFLGSTGYYPLMLIYVYLLFLWLLKRNLLDKAFPCIPMLLGIHFALSMWSDLPWYCYGNFLLTGLPLFLLGHWLHRIHPKLPASPGVYGCLLLLGVGLVLVESGWNPDGYCYLGSVVMAASLLLWAVHHPWQIGSTAGLNMMKRFSMYIFVIHCGIRDILEAFLNRQQITLSNNTFVALVIAVSLAICGLWNAAATWGQPET